MISVLLQDQRLGSELELGNSSVLFERKHGRHPPPPARGDLEICKKMQKGGMEHGVAGFFHV